MSVPSRPEAASLLASLDPPAWHLRHSRAVAEVAGWLAMRIEDAGGAVDRRLVETAALLHDVDKLPAVRPEVAGLRHGDGSAAWLTARGYPELGPAIAGHPVTRLADGAWFDRWFGTAQPEELVVAYADKRAGQHLESVAERFGSWQRRYPPAGGGGSGWSIDTIADVRRRADTLERRVCEMACVEPSAVRRLRWTGAALAGAALGGVGGAARAARRA